VTSDSSVSRVGDHDVGLDLSAEEWELLLQKDNISPTISPIRNFTDGFLVNG